jgi:DnaJ-class molecular chaperone
VTVDLYDSLGVDDDADADAIKTAYRRRAQATHPDRAGGDDAQFKEVQLAYEVLSDPKRRATYDESGHTDKEPQIEDQATSRVINVFKAVMEEYPDGNLMQHAHVMVADAISKMMNMIQVKERRKLQLIKRSTRIKIKQPGKHDLYKQLMAAEIKECTTTISEMTNEIEINRVVKTMLDDYEDVSPTGFYQ